MCVKNKTATRSHLRTKRQHWMQARGSRTKWDNMSQFSYVTFVTIIASSCKFYITLSLARNHVPHSSPFVVYSFFAVVDEMTHSYSSPSPTVNIACLQRKNTRASGKSRLFHISKWHFVVPKVCDFLEHRAPRWVDVQLGSTAKQRSLAHENLRSCWTQKCSEK